jgi:hypothetical protein
VVSVIRTYNVSIVLEDLDAKIAARQPKLMFQPARVPAR